MLKIKKNGAKEMPDGLRIKFWGSEYTAYADRMVFKKFALGDITAAEGAHCISLNNKTPVNEKQFLANAEWLGYIKTW